MNRLDAIAARAANATPGRWYSEGSEEPWQYWARLYPSLEDGAVPIILLEDVEEADVEFIAHARDDVPALLAVAMAARALLVADETMSDTVDDDFEALRASLAPMLAEEDAA